MLAHREYACVDTLLYDDEGELRIVVWINGAASILHLLELEFFAQFQLCITNTITVNE